MNTLAVLSLVTALLAWVSIRFVLKSPALRRTMWPVWLLHLLSAALFSIWAVAALALYPDSILSGGGLCAIFTLASFVLFLIVYLVALRMPPTEGRPEIGSPLPHFLVTVDDGIQLSPRELLGKGPSMIVFFRGFWCLSCTDELMGLTQVREALRKNGGDILAISADKLPIFLMGRKRNPNIPCKLACDPGAEAITALHLLQENMAKVGKKVAIPTNILIDSEGIVRWTHYANIVMDRPDPRLVLEKVAALR